MLLYDFLRISLSPTPPRSPYDYKYGFSDAFVFDLLYFNAGLKINKHISVFGSLSLSSFDATTTFYLHDGYYGHYEEEKEISKTMPRYGFGLQYEWYMDESKDGLIGLRFTYMTGKYDCEEYNIHVKGNINTYKLLLYVRGGFDMNKKLK